MTTTTTITTKPLPRRLIMTRSSASSSCTSTALKATANKFKEAFHEDAWIFFTDADGVLRKDILIDCFERWAAADRHIEGRIIFVTQAGDVARVLLGYDNTADPSRCFVDFHALLRINGVWKITNKTATHSSRAAWAKAQ